MSTTYLELKDKTADTCIYPVDSDTSVVTNAFYISVWTIAVLVIL